MTHYPRDKPPRPSMIRIGDTVEMECASRGEKQTTFSVSPCCKAESRISASDLGYMITHRDDPMEVKRTVARKCGHCKAGYWLEFPEDFGHMIWKLKKL